MLSGAKIDSIRVSFWFSLLLFSLSFRGLFELLMPKPYAMAFQLILCILSSLMLLCFRREPFSIAYSRKDIILCGTLFVPLIVFSAFLTSWIREFDGWVPYLLFTVFFLYFSFFVLQIRDFGGGFPIFSLLLFAWIQLSFALLEQLQFAELPGASNLFYQGFRTGGLTGSFLHYPLFMALASFIFIQCGITHRKRGLFYSGLLFLSAPFLVLSRSGMFIVLFSLFLLSLQSALSRARRYLTLSLVKKWGAFLLLFFLSTFGIALIISLFFQGEGINERALERIIKPYSVGEGANQTRVEIWKNVFSDYLSTNLLFGEHLGLITNATNNLLPQATQLIAESSVLQQMMNFGVLGMAVFYAILVQFYFLIEKEHHYLRALFIACLLQTLFYQSIEVVLFICLFLMIPLVSKSLKEEEMKRCIVAT